MEQVNRLDIERDGLSSTGGSIGISKTKHIDKWLELIRQQPEEWAAHREREREYQNRIKNNFKY
jgi:hypothetical protein